MQAPPQRPRQPRDKAWRRTKDNQEARLYQNGLGRGRMLVELVLACEGRGRRAYRDSAVMSSNGRPYDATRASLATTLDQEVDVNVS